MVFDNPFEAPGEWLKGNLHTHTTASDGQLTPAEAVRWYEENDYDFVALTDHDVFCDPAPLQLATRLLLLPGFEYSCGPVREAHMLCLGVRQAYRGGYQEALTTTRALGGMAVFCHPNWVRDDLWSPDAMSELCYYSGMEIYNHVITRLPGSALATDDWDAMLTRGNLLWGYADQDAHRPTDFGHAWNMALSPTRTVQGVLHALANGHCYASTGLAFREIGLRDGAVHARLARRATVRFIGPHGAVLHERRGIESSFTPGGEAYVRVEAEDGDGCRAWSQPFWRISE